MVIRFLRVLYILYFAWAFIFAVYTDSGFMDTYNFEIENMRDSLSVLEIYWSAFGQFIGFLVATTVPFIFVMTIASYIVFGRLNMFFVFQKPKEPTL